MKSPTDEIEAHEDALIRAFADVLRAEDKTRTAKSALQEAKALYKPRIASSEAEAELAWGEIARLLAETGEFEVTLPGAANDYHIGWSSPRESVKVDDAAAVPDEWVKVERKPKLKEIGDELRVLRKSGRPLPNWARLEKGEPKLCWTAVKKS